MVRELSDQENEARLYSELSASLNGLLAALESGSVWDAYGERREVGQDIERLNAGLRLDVRQEDPFWAKVQELVDTVSVLDMGWVRPANQVRALLGMPEMVRKEEVGLP
jgi:hypothetical protein